MLGLAVQLVLFSDFVTERIGAAGVPIYVGSTLAVAAVIAANLRIRGMAIVLLGAISNLAAIVANGGYMPASVAAIESLGKPVKPGYSNSSFVADPVLPWLTDIFALPPWVPFSNVFSIGDVLIALGVVVVIASAMRSPVAAGRGSLAGRVDRTKCTRGRPRPTALRRRLTAAPGRCALALTRTAIGTGTGGPFRPCGPRDDRSQQETTSVSAIERSKRQTRREAGTQSQGSPPTGRPPGCRNQVGRFASSEREIREDDPGTAVVGPHDARRHGADHRCRDAVAGLMKHFVNSTHLRLLLALSSLASLAFVIEAGHRW